MKDGYETLTREIKVVIGSPYPTSLKGLEEILSIKCKTSDLERWALSSPCQIDPLVERVLDSLRHWSYTYRIGARLCEIEVVRDAFLRQQPSLAHDVIASAIRSLDVTSRHAFLATAIFSHPLPDETPLPANFEEWLVCLFKLAAASPSTAIMETIYKILKATATSMVSLLSPEMMAKLESQLLNIVRGVNRDHQWPGLYCLSIMNILAHVDVESLQSNSTSFDTEPLLASNLSHTAKWSPDVMQLYFSGSKAQKTAQLLVLRAMWACTISTGEPHDEKMETLKMAHEVVSAIPAQALALWVEANCVTMRKLEEKICAPQLDAGVRFLALCFMVKLYEHAEPPPEIQYHLRSTIQELNNICEALSILSYTELEKLIGGSIFDRDTTSGLLRNITPLVVRGTQDEQIFSPSILKLLRVLSSAQILNDGISEGALSAFNVLVTQGYLEDLDQACKTEKSLIRHRLHDRVSCEYGSHSFWNGTIHALCAIFFRAMLCSVSVQNKFSHDTTDLLLNLFVKSAPTTNIHQHNFVRHVPATDTSIATSILENPCIEFEGDWRQSLRACLQSRTEAEFQKVSDIFTTACSELRRRCDKAELPGKEEKERYSALRGHFDKTQQRCVELEALVSAQKTTISALQTQNEKYLDETSVRDKQMTELSEHVIELEHELLKVKASAQEQFNDEIRKNKMLELEHATAFAKQEEELEDIQEQLRLQSDEFSSKTRENEYLSVQIEAQLSKIVMSEKKTRDLAQAYADMKAELERVALEKAAAFQSFETAQQESQRIQRETDTLKLQHDEETKKLQQQLKEELERAEWLGDQKRLDLKRTYEAELETAQKEMSLLQTTSREREDLMLRTQEQQTSKLVAKDQLIENLQRKCEQKRRQIAEASAMRTNLMAAMGLQQAASVEIRRASRSTGSTTSKAFGDDETQTHHLLQAQVDGASSFSNGSSAESVPGPTPKRQRPRKSFKPIYSRSPHSSASMRRNATRQHPLSTISGNSPMKQFRTVNSTQQRSVQRLDGQEQDDFQDDSTFDGSDIFVGTQANRFFDLDAK